MAETQSSHHNHPLGLSSKEILADYRIGFMSRQASLIGRKEVLSGKAKFGIFGDGKEVAQLAMARAFKKGDWRSGYYRDQTFMLAIGALDIKKFFAQLYADADVSHDPSSAGRQMNSHFATRYIDENGQWRNQCMMKNSSADISPTAGQMSRSVGLAYASKIYRENKAIEDHLQFSNKGQEVSFVTIGNASTSEGVFWESLNAAGVLRVPLVIIVWDDGYGISVPNRYQTTKESISKILAGFQHSKDEPGVDIKTVKGWDYGALCATFADAAEAARKDHTPALIHVQDMTQPQGHSTSGSHERYKDGTRLQYETDADCLKKMREWMLAEGVCDAAKLAEIENSAIEEVKDLKAQAWQEFLAPIKNEQQEAANLIAKFGEVTTATYDHLTKAPTINRKVVQSALQKAVIETIGIQPAERQNLLTFLDEYIQKNARRYNTFLLSESSRSSIGVSQVHPTYDGDETVDGRQIIQKFFDKLLADDPRVFIIGEDVGKIGGVNSEFEGLNEKHGEIRVTDTGIREATILGQGIGAAIRGLRPIVDIQYLDYLLYCFQTLSDDLASLHYRTAGGQIAPVIIRTKGHRLEGIWHSGSPIGMILSGVRGVHVCVPRDMTQAAGMYRTLLQGDDPGLVIEVLNGYRRKEKLPTNLGEYNVPLGLPEVLRLGKDVTIVTYGACVQIAFEGAKILEACGVDAEIIDVQTLLPFDKHGVISTSLEKTGAILFLDEDVPGGATAFMMQNVLEHQRGYELLDAPPKTLSAQPHRPSYGTDGDYFSKPNAEDVFHAVYDLVREREPHRFPALRS